jgi:hypothetical protein
MGENQLLMNSRVGTPRRGVRGRRGAPTLPKTDFAPKAEETALKDLHPTPRQPFDE